MKYVGLASLVLAAVLGANTASAAFIDIDRFDSTGTTPDGALGGTRSGVSGTFSGGALNSLTAGTGFLYTITFGSAQNLVASDTPVLRLAGVTASTVNGLNSIGLRLNGSGSTLSTSLLAGRNSYDFSGFTVAQLQNVTQIDIAYLGGANELRIEGLHAVPEPTTLALIGMASVAGGAGAWRKRRKASV